MNYVKAKYIITGAFSIREKGIIFSGFIVEGQVSIGDTIEFTAIGKLLRKEIIGVDYSNQEETKQFGILIQCSNNSEILELKNWKPINEMATISGKTDSR